MFNHQSVKAFLCPVMLSSYGAPKWWESQTEVYVELELNGQTQNKTFSKMTDW